MRFPVSPNGGGCRGSIEGSPIRHSVQRMQRKTIAIVSMGTLLSLHLGWSTKEKQRPRRTSEPSVHSCNQVAGVNGASWYLANNSSAVSFCYSAVGPLEFLIEQKATNGAPNKANVSMTSWLFCLEHNFRAPFASRAIQIGAVARNPKRLSTDASTIGTKLCSGTKRFLRRWH